MISHENLKSGVNDGTQLFLETFQYPILNKNVEFNSFFMLKII